MLGSWIIHLSYFMKTRKQNDGVIILSNRLTLSDYIHTDPQQIRNVGLPPPTLLKLKLGLRHSDSVDTADEADRCRPLRVKLILSAYIHGPLHYKWQSFFFCEIYQSQNPPSSMRMSIENGE